MPFTTTASQMLAAGCFAATTLRATVVAAEVASDEGSCKVGATCQNPLAKDQVLIQLHRSSSERLAANVSSVKCDDCCGGCDGKMYCSPQSGKCYDSKRKDYYNTCSTSASPAPTSTKDCCGGCDGKPYCSPGSGNCYDSKRKDYYKTCSTSAPVTTTAATSPPSTTLTTTDGEGSSSSSAGAAEGCCAACAGAPFCSPNSNSCYYTKNKDYYKTCDAEAAARWRAAPQCCADCPGKKPFYSPNSKNCYASKAKDYYEACPEAPVNAPSSGACKVGGNNWCAAEVPDATFSFKQCPGLGGMRVKLLTYNLFWWNLFNNRGGNGRSAGRLIENAARDEAFDVAAFQECDDARRIMNDARMYESEYDYVRWGSNTIAYRKTRWERLSYGKGEKFAEDANGRWQRGAHWVRLQEKTSGKKLFVLNHHGPLPINSGGKCGGEATAYNMLKMAEENSEEGDAIMLTGDFNADAGSQTVTTLKSYIHLIMSDWVDMIMSNCAGSAVKQTKNLGKGGSDHDALMSIVEF